MLGEDGTIAAFVLDDRCNGPGCSVCGWAVCWHCERDPEKVHIPTCEAVQAENEARERSELARLLAKYGVPESEHR